MFNLRQKRPLLLLILLVILLGLALAFFTKSEPGKKQQEQISTDIQSQIIGQSTTIQGQNPIENGPSQEKDEQSDENQSIDTFITVTRVIDGDTIEIEGGQKVRYIGIDTPETVDPRSLPQCFGKEAASKNRELVEGKNISIEKDVSETDKYGRLLRYIYLNDIFINDYLVREGYAYASSYPPDVKYQNQLKQAQLEAQEQNRGLWARCQNQNSSATIYNMEGCQIKGNISSSGEKIYHLPTQRYYEKTVIDESKGERWFCTEDEAQKSGWRKSKI